MTGRIGVYPGTFNPPTVAHLAIAEAALAQGGLDRVDLVISSVALGKEDLARPTVEERLAVLGVVASTRPWLAVRGTDRRLVADIAAGADAVILGADKWAQVVDPAWYEDEAGRDRAVAALPLVLVAPRPPDSLPSLVPDRVQPLDLADVHAVVSSTEVRSGRWEWMLPEAVASGLWAALG